MHRLLAHDVALHVCPIHRVVQWRRRALAVSMVALCFIGRRGNAQSDFGVWTGFSVTGKLPTSVNDSAGRWRGWMDLQLRFGDDASRLSQTIVRPGIGYALSREWTLWAGYARAWTEPPYAGQSTTENRIWEQASWGGAIGRTRLGSRTRLEQRFVSTGDQTSWRLREQVKATYPLGANSIWSAVVSDEYFLNLKPTSSTSSAGSDRNRFFVGPGVKLNRVLTLEAGYMNQYIFSTSGSGKTDHILSMNLQGSL